MDIYYENSTSNSSYSMYKVFGWMFYAIILTAIAAFGVPLLIASMGGTLDTLNGVILVASIVVLVLSFATPTITMKTKSSATAVGIFSLFAIAMGTMISYVVIIYDLNIIIYALGVTSLIFGAMAIYGYVTKRDLSGFGSFLMMILIGSLLMTVINIFIGSQMMDFIISYIILGVYIGFIAYDIQNVKRIASRGMLNTNISLLMALNLYLDFIYIFIRLVSIISNSKRN